MRRNSLTRLSQKSPHLNKNIKIRITASNFSNHFLIIHSRIRMVIFFAPENEWKQRTVLDVSIIQGHCSQIGRSPPNIRWGILFVLRKRSESKKPKGTGRRIIALYLLEARCESKCLVISPTKYSQNKLINNIYYKVVLVTWWKWGK